MSYTINIIPFAELALEDLYDLMALRCDVFMVEQEILCSEFDYLDQKCLHVLLKDSKKLCAYCRIIPPETPNNYAKIGRVVVHPDARKNGYGQIICQKAVQIIFAKYSCDTIYISGQLYLDQFYKNLGFLAASDPYLEEGIMHRSYFYFKDPKQFLNPQNFQTFRLYYLNHSAFYLETPTQRLLFDYGSVPARQGSSLNDGIFNFEENEKPLYIFSSHYHADHFSRSLQQKAATFKNCYYIQGEDDFVKNIDQQESTSYQIGPHQTLTLPDLKIETLRSTDAGVAFILELEGLTIYFAGDLANWDDDGFSQQVFPEEMKRLRTLRKNKTAIDLAFLPAGTSDDYQDDCLIDGFIEQIDILNPHVIIPMHGYQHEWYYAKIYEHYAKLYPETPLHQRKSDIKASSQQQENPLIFPKIKQFLFPEKGGDSWLFYK